MKARLPNTIFIGGGFCSGKAFVAAQLINEFGYTRIGFADELKSEVAKIFRITVDEVNANKGEYRKYLQLYGEAMCNIFGEDYWVKRFLERRKATPGRVVVPDLRKHIECSPEYGVSFRIEVSFEERMKRYEALYGVLPTEAQLNPKSEIEVPDLKVDFVLPGDLSPDDILDAVVWCSAYFPYTRRGEQLTLESVINRASLLDVSKIMTDVTSLQIDGFSKGDPLWYEAQLRGDFMELMNKATILRPLKGPNLFEENS